MKFFEDVYLDYMNNFLTIEGMMDFYKTIDPHNLRKWVKLGKVAHDSKFGYIIEG